MTPAPASAGKWTRQYFYDELESELTIVDLAFPSARRGVAVGTIADREGERLRHIALVTSDGGAKWSPVALKEAPRSVFFLNENAGWLVTNDGFWFTEESGRSWTRIADQIKPNKKLENAPSDGLILRVYFLDEKRGYAVGLQKSAYETNDGGRTWSPIEEASKATSNPAYTTYTNIAFTDGKAGLIVGAYAPPRRNGEIAVPEWLDPEKTLKRIAVPRLTLALDTRDRGKTWTASTAPLIGSVGAVTMAGQSGLLVFNYPDSFDWPSEVYRMYLDTGKTETIFRQKDALVTDAALFAGGRSFLAAVEPPGRLRSAPIPGRVRILVSDDFKTWLEMDVDYRAQARFLTIAGPDQDHVWAATDTGMILVLKK